MCTIVSARWTRVNLNSNKPNTLYRPYVTCKPNTLYRPYVTRKPNTLYRPYVTRKPNTLYRPYVTRLVSTLMARPDFKKNPTYHRHIWPTLTSLVQCVREECKHSLALIAQIVFSVYISPRHCSTLVNRTTKVLWYIPWMYSLKPRCYILDLVTNDGYFNFIYDSMKK